MACGVAFAVPAADCCEARQSGARYRRLSHGCWLFIGQAWRWLDDAGPATRLLVTIRSRAIPAHDVLNELFTVQRVRRAGQCCNNEQLKEMTMSGILAQLGLTSGSETSQPTINVGEVERWGSAFAGGLLLVRGVERGRLPGLVLAGIGASLLYRGFTGHCKLYDKLGMSTRSSGQSLGVPAKTGFKFEQSITINRPAQELYEYWRQLSNLPRIMQHLESVTESGNFKSHWVAKGPMGIRVQWDAEVHNEDPGRLIAWRSMPGGQVDTAGSVRFEEQGSNTTGVHVSLKYNPPGGKLGANLAWLMGSSVEKEVASDLCRFKQAMENGEISLIKGHKTASQKS
jgi:uncharacterized membrane protein